jgi:predicted RNA-binding protein YlxR (DUF448 family)
VGCRERFDQAALARFTHGARWQRDGTRRAPGRGAYLCSRSCAERALRNKRFAALAKAALEATWP